MTVPKGDFQKAEGYFERGPDMDLSAITARCFERDGLHYCSAVHTEVLTSGGMIIVAMGAGRAGLAVHFTPEGIRSLCADLLRVAEKTEAESTQNANAQLAAALSRKGA